jgi:Flp pilus assembly protein TadD
MTTDTHTDPAEVEISSAEQTELDSCRRSFSAAPSFTTLRKLAELWTTGQHWELAAEAWIHVAHARPNDAQAYARAATALEHLRKHADAARMWEHACRIQPNNPQYANAHAQAVRDSQPPIAQTVSSAGNCSQSRRSTR